MSGSIDVEKGAEKPFSGLDARKPSNATEKGAVTVLSLKDADEAVEFLSNHPRAAEISAEGNAILEDPVQLKKLIRKIDFTIAPLLAAVYFLQFLDKTTLSYTAVMGMRTDTHLKGQDYSNISMLFYIGFLAAEFPTQYLAQHISRLGLYLGTNIILWGIVLCCHAACTSFAGLAICRTLLGVFESCVAPILVLVIAMWYKKEEQGRRVSCWRIFFVAIGAATMCIGALVCIFLPDSPVKARRFTDAEKVAALLRTKNNQRYFFQTPECPFALANLHIRVWLVCICTLLSSIPNGGLSNFNNILLTTFGYSSREALILAAPSGAVGVVCVLLVGYLSDKWHDRSSVMLICTLPTILGAGLMIGLDPNGVPKNKPGLLAASFLTGTFGAAFMLMLAWNASNIGGHTKKVTVNAITLVSFALGNILGTQTFQDYQAPGYISGKISIVATLGALCFMILVLRWFNDRLNKQNEIQLAGMTEEEKEELRDKMAFADETDRKNPFFRYTH
ncbi:hypothetical protein M430DRAFT_48970 [Amorphotheca resinae ATCC 22711]|uniref:Major facilitator superfamily (MFS) profile domain-containing protein n=1 Tax=Amorphotheca resinae ATCC 22711 TaxID=857342 RepID=A0A2T3B987_AMORE|nr:hypothetical protein M430DRAFT_48970 [Amorphotheca resinae ATCC 22711]PSS23403.1 hypothetical protein M430DRAFT_48970 [Amorphotheca resinae ATCC 22711]